MTTKDPKLYHEVPESMDTRKLGFFGRIRHLFWIVYLELMPLYLLNTFERFVSLTIAISVFTLIFTATIIYFPSAIKYTVGRIYYYYTGTSLGYYEHTEL